MQVGQAPKVMFYIFGCAALGTFMVTAANGSKAASSVQAGLQRWTKKLDDNTKLEIMRMRYGSSEKAVQKFRQADPQKAARIFPADKRLLVAKDFTDEGFLVCVTYNKPATDCSSSYNWGGNARLRSTLSRCIRHLRNILPFRASCSLLTGFWWLRPSTSTATGVPLDKTNSVSM